MATTSKRRPGLLACLLLIVQVGLDSVVFIPGTSLKNANWGSVILLKFGPGYSARACLAYNNLLWRFHRSIGY